MDGDWSGWQAPEIDVVAAQLDVNPAVLGLVLSHIRQSPAFPLFGPRDGKAPITVYLDTLHWVALAKARLGRPALSADMASYKFLRDATQAGDVVIALCATTYIEIQNIGSYRQRSDLADIIAELSGFVTLISATIAKDQQIEDALAKHLGGEAPTPLPVFGIGIGFAFGIMGGMRVNGPASTMDDSDREQIKLFEERSTAVSEYAALRGPSTDELPELRDTYGYDPEPSLEVERRRVDQEKDLASKLTENPEHRDKLSRIVAARELLHEVSERLQIALDRRGMTMEEFLDQGQNWLLEFLQDIPSAAVSIRLRDRNFRNSYKTWKGNDIRDIDAMVEAVPYCDYVLSDKHVVAQLADSDAVRRSGTVVLAKLEDLTARLARSETYRRPTRRKFLGHPLEALGPSSPASHP